MNNRHIPLPLVPPARTTSAMPRAPIEAVVRVDAMTVDGVERKLGCTFRHFYVLEFQSWVRVLTWKREMAAAGKQMAAEIKALLKQVRAARKEFHRGEARALAPIL